MKRLLLVTLVVVAALTISATASAKAQSTKSTASLTAACGTGGSVCPLGQSVTFYGAGMDPSRSWQYCYTQVNTTSPCLPVPLAPVNQDGTLTFSLDGTLFRVAGSYTVYLFEQVGRNLVNSGASVMITVG